MDAEIVYLPPRPTEKDRRQALLGILRYVHGEAAAMKLGVVPALLEAAMLEIEQQGNAGSDAGAARPDRPVDDRG